MAERAATRRAMPALLLLALVLLVGCGERAAPGADGGPESASTDPPARSDSAGRLPLSRRVDPSLDRYLFTEQPRTPRRAMSGAQLWLADHAEPLVAHDSDPRVSLFVLGWEQRPPTSVYVNATGVNVDQPERLREAGRWLVRRGGRPVMVDRWQMLDVRVPEARRWWLYGNDGRASCTAARELRGALDLLACGYDGLWVDNVLLQPSAWFRPDPGIDAGAWSAGVVALLRELRAALPTGRGFVVNAHWTDLRFPWTPDPRLDPDGAHATAGRLADQVVVEGGAIDSGLAYRGGARDPWSYRRLLAYADAMHGAGARLQWEKTHSGGTPDGPGGLQPECRDEPGSGPGWRRGSDRWRAHVISASFNAATAWLTATRGDGVGDMCEYPGRGWEGYDVDLGAPLGPREDDGSVLTRRFERGLVAVNTGERPARLSFPGGRRGVDVARPVWPAGSRPVAATATVPAMQASVVAYR